LFILFATASAVTNSAHADEAVTVMTPSGPLVIAKVDSDLEAMIFGGNGSLRVNTAYMPDVLGTQEDSVLLRTSTGGTACPSLYVWVTLNDAGLRKTEEFGTCSDLGELQATAEGTMLVMPRMGTAGTAGYVLNADNTVTEIELGLAPSGIADVKDASAWAGEAAYSVLTAPEMEAALLEIMSWNDLEKVRNASAVSSDTMSQDGEWFFAGGCMPHMCNEISAGVAISANDGRVIAGYWSKDDRGELFGKPDTTLPNGMRELLASGY
jgi:hypothetical protein